ncbi:MAG: hypothetical protein M1409_09810 [Actinobacteria bacterium]|nr:hypothetical protein [Actinomycetota bacterium]
MKKGINLLVRQSKYLNLEKKLAKVKVVIVLMLILFVVTYFTFLVFLNKQKKDIDTLNNQKKSYMEFLLQNKQTEAKFTVFQNKEKQLSDILEQDVNFLPYYNLLKDSLKSSTPAANLDSVSVDKSRTVNFTVSFTDYKAFLSFLKFAEGDSFLKNFNKLVLSNFSAYNQKINTQSSYKLQLSGVFINLNEP